MSTALAVKESTNVRTWVSTLPRLLGGAVAALSLVAPGLATRAAFRLFTFPARYPAPAREAAALARSRPMQIPFGRGALAARVWGQGHRTVLLVHGWSGRAAQMGVIGEALAHEGLRAVAMEMPGHGASPGRSLNIFEAADAVAAAVRHLGPVEAIVAHSFGVPSTVYAMRAGLPVERLVAVAPADPGKAVARFAQATGIGDRLHDAMLDLLVQRFGLPLGAMALAHLARDLEVPGMVVHDRHDRMVPFEDGARMAAAWTGSVLVETEGLGHGRILRDRAVVARIVDQINEGRMRCSA